MLNQFDMADDDRVFWDRLEEMPAWEAEQECVLRREHNALAMNMLQSERERAKSDNERRAIGVELFRVAGQNSLLNERIRYLRRLENKVQWKEAVKEVLGADAFNACVEWIEASVYAEHQDMRRQWAKARGAARC